MYLANALIVLAIMALVIPAVLFAAYIIGAATLPPIFCRIVLRGDFSDIVTRWHPMGR